MILDSLVVRTDARDHDQDPLVEAEIVFVTITTPIVMSGVMTLDAATVVTGLSPLEVEVDTLQDHMVATVHHLVAGMKTRTRRQLRLPPAWSA